MFSEGKGVLCANARPSVISIGSTLDFLLLIVGFHINVRGPFDICVSGRPSLIRARFDMTKKSLKIPVTLININNPNNKKIGRC